MNNSNRNTSFKKIFYGFLSLLLLGNVLAYTVTTPRVNTNDILTKSLWDRVVDDLLAMTGLINTNTTNIATNTTNISTNTTNISNLGSSVKFVDGTIPVNAVFTAGDVGIGTTSPNSKFEVEGGKIQNKAGAVTTEFFSASSTNKGYVGTLSNHSFILRTNDLDRLIIDTNGNVGIGTTIPAEKLEVNGNIQATAFIYSSDKSLKNNIKTIKNPLDKVMALRGVHFNWKKSGNASMGFIAQEVETIIPELVHTNPQTNLKAVEYGNITALLVEAVKELKKENEVLLSEIQTLKSK